MTETPTQSQIALLKRLSSQDGSLALTDKDLGKLSKEAASRMIDSILKNNPNLRKKSRKARSAYSAGSPVASSFRTAAKSRGMGLFSLNYRAENGAWSVARMTANEEEELRKVHGEHCSKVLRECISIYPEDYVLAIALFDKRADKFYSWAQAFLEEKVRCMRESARNGSAAGGERNV